MYATRLVDISRRMECPKCGHRQLDTVKCESCGIYFAKFHAQRVPSPSSGQRIGLGGIALTAAISAVTVMFVMHGHPPQAHSDRYPGIDTHPNAAQANAQLTSAEAIPNNLTSPVEPLVGLAAQIANASPPRNAIEAARNATVLIKTGWGSGSGFILDSQCHVITNRHVVDTNGTRVANMVIDPQVQSRIVNAQQQLQVSIANSQRLRSEWTDQPGHNMDIVELTAHIKLMQTKLVELSNTRQAVSDKVESSGREGFSVTLVDGTIFEGLHAEISTNTDLALVRLPADHCPFISTGNSMALKLGERLFTIGNPLGLTDSVTSGVFSGQQNLNDQRALQTDAPINHGNSGGPLITENSQVVGINTMVLAGAQGIGFAIPIETAFHEFSELTYLDRRLRTKE